MKTFTDFRTQTLRQIRIWAWIAAVLPISALAGIFFIWYYGSNSMFGWAMIIGETAMFSIAVIWWWWAIYVINRLVRHWDQTRLNVFEVLTELGEIKQLAKETFATKRDK